MGIREQRLIKLAKVMCSDDLKIDAESPEYQVLDYLLNDDELAVMSEMKLVTPCTAKSLAKKAGILREDKL